MLKHNFDGTLNFSVIISLLLIFALAEKTFLFLLSEQVLGRVTDLRVMNVNGRRIRIAWTGLPGATGYRVSWKQGSSKFVVFVSLITLNLNSF